jgi:hypothetical protein
MPWYDLLGLRLRLLALSRAVNIDQSVDLGRLGGRGQYSPIRVYDDQPAVVYFVMFHEPIYLLLKNTWPYPTRVSDDDKRRALIASSPGCRTGKNYTTLPCCKAQVTHGPRDGWIDGQIT